MPSSFISGSFVLLFLFSSLSSFLHWPGLFLFVFFWGRPPASAHVIHSLFNARTAPTVHLPCTIGSSGLSSIIYTLCNRTESALERHPAVVVGCKGWGVTAGHRLNHSKPTLLPPFLLSFHISTQLLLLFLHFLLLPASFYIHRYSETTQRHLLFVSLRSVRGADLQWV